MPMINLGLFLLMASVFAEPNCPPNTIKLFPKYDDCTKYWMCYQGVATLESCKFNYEFSPTRLLCLTPKEAQCSTSTGPGGPDPIKPELLQLDGIDDVYCVTSIVEPNPKVFCKHMIYSQFNGLNPAFEVFDLEKFKMFSEIYTDSRIGLHVTWGCRSPKELDIALALTKNIKYDFIVGDLGCLVGGEMPITDKELISINPYFSAGGIVLWGIPLMPGSIHPSSWETFTQLIEGYPDNIHVPPINGFATISPVGLAPSVSISRNDLEKYFKDFVVTKDEYGHYATKGTMRFGIDSDQDITDKYCYAKNANKTISIWGLYEFPKVVELLKAVKCDKV